MIKAVIFDCFGVLVTEGWLQFKARYFGDKPELFEQVTDISHRADRGLISRETAIEETSRLAGITPLEFRQAMGHNVPDEILFEYIRELKPSYKVGFLSNVSGNYLLTLFTPEHLALFDALTLSFECGWIKPEAEAYEAAAKDLGVDVGEAVMVDDQERNITGACEAGMEAILYSDAAQLRHELGRLLAKS